jgi:hypothetical protein
MTKKNDNPKPSIVETSQKELDWQIMMTKQHGGYTKPNGKRARREYWDDEKRYVEIISSDIPGIGFQAVEDGVKKSEEV